MDPEQNRWWMKAHHQTMMACVHADEFEQTLKVFQRYKLCASPSFQAV